MSEKLISSGILGHYDSKIKEYSDNKYAKKTDIPSTLPANGGNAATVNNHTVNSDVPANAKFTDTTYSNFVKSGSGAKSGLVPAPSTTAGTTKYLREDGTWQTPPNTTYSDMKGATSSAVGTHGLVPAPAAGKHLSFLRGDGTWVIPTNTTYNEATQDKAGLLSASDKTKLDGIANNANNYTHPSYTAKSAGLYKVTVDNKGHVSAATAVVKNDITALGIPAENTTYSEAIENKAGLMSATDKAKLDGISDGAKPGTITGISVNGTVVSKSGDANITSIPASILTGAIPSSVTASTQSAGDNSTKIATTAFVTNAVNALADPMIFMGSVGTNGTLTTLPNASADNKGHTYKVITNGTYSGVAAKSGDTLI